MSRTKPSAMSLYTILGPNNEYCMTVEAKNLRLATWKVEELIEDGVIDLEGDLIIVREPGVIDCGGDRITVREATAEEAAEWQAEEDPEGGA